MACITSAAENSFVYSLAKDDQSLWLAVPPTLEGPWIGGYRSGSAWLWVSGEPFVYKNWRPGEPNGTGYRIGLAGAYPNPGAGWNDVYDSRLEHAYVIESALPTPIITEQPQSCTNVVGTTASFSIIAVSTLPLSYQWYFGSTPLVDGGPFSGATSPDLTITGVQASEEGSYRVVVANAAGSTSSEWATLTVFGRPSIVTNPVTQTVWLGAPATFTVLATGTAPLNYQWYFNSQPITGATDSSFTITPTVVDSVGNYVVEVWNVAGTNWSSSASLWLNSLKLYAGVLTYGPMGSNCVVRYATNLAAPVLWTPLDTVTVATNPTVTIDYESPDQPRRFYQTVPQ
ncbi:MAG TPA: hypothetical protein PKI20_21665 [Verrucomicrobiota bacterium]|nr:hypothetical protein [Verrucomicrobiota bacterium]HQL79842.1 hypothetical protein [Verrucomicrobiota bacterium]